MRRPTRRIKPWTWRSVSDSSNNECSKQRTLSGDATIKLKSNYPLYQIVLKVAPALAAGKSQTLTGEVSDAMCGAKHEMPGSAAECTRACMKHGSKYALVVGDKVYTLETSDKAALDKLNDLAGARAKVTGDVDGTTIAVKAVAAGS